MLLTTEHSTDSQVYVAWQGVKEYQKHRSKCAYSKRVRYNHEHSQDAHSLRFFFFCWSWSKTDWQVQQRDTFRETHSEIWINTEYIQSELDKHSFHAIQWKHLKHDWSVPWFFVSAFASFSPFLSYLQTFNVIEASIVQGRFLTWGALTWWHRMQVTFFFKCPTFAEE